MNSDKLKGKIKEQGKTQFECALILRISSTTFSNKINEVTSFSIHEVNQLSKYLQLNDKEKIEIFMEGNNEKMD